MAAICWSVPSSRSPLRTINDIEHIVMDGGSTDASLEIIEPTSVTNLTKVVSEKDNGQYDAIGKGFAMATRRYPLLAEQR